jgi:hypothetical protein
VVVTISLQDSLFWMKAYRELLAVNEQALRRMQTLVAAHSGPPDECEADVQLIATEIDRVTDRLRYWEETVDSLQLRPLQR